MLDSLDTLIGFALIFTVVSLLVTIVVQMITSVAHLRGKNLAWAVAETFEAIEPKLVAQTDGAGKKLADYVLRDPLLSDKQVRDKVGPATAVRPEELFDLLYRIATGQKKIEKMPRIEPGNKPNPAIDKKNKRIDEYNNSVAEKTAELAKVREHVLALFKKLGIDEADLTPDGVAAVADAKIDAMKQTAETITDPVLKQKFIDAMNQVANDADVMKANAVELEARLRTAYQKFEAWLDTSQERAEEWFRTHARYVTLGVGIVFAAVLQLDTIEIFQTVSSNKGMRDKLVAQANTVLGQGEKILVLKGDDLATAYQAWQKEESTSEANAAVKAAVVKLDLKVEEQDTRDSIHRKVADQLKFNAAAPDSAGAADAATAALTKLDAAFDKTVNERLGQGAKEYLAMKDDLSKTGFALFPNGGWRWVTGADITFGHGIESILRHWLGILASILLLSLGAPFWFNLLKSLGNLRSSVANNIATEDKADEKYGSNPPPGTPPNTIVSSGQAPAVNP